MCSANTKWCREVLTKKVLILSIALFLLSLALPGVTVPGQESVFGFELLLVGWIGVGSYDFPWYANILYFSSLANMRPGRYTIAYRLSPIEYSYCPPFVYSKYGSFF